MDTSTETTPVEPGKRSRKTSLLIVAAIVVIMGSVYAYIWQRHVHMQAVEVQASLTELANLRAFKEAATAEYDRCQGFIAQQEGDFGSFEYCQKFITWSNEHHLAD